MYRGPVVTQRRPVALCLVLVLLGAGATAQDDVDAQEAAAKALSIPDVRAADLKAWSVHLRPCADELAWRAIPWLDTFAAGVLAADEEKKPLLFWAMNGHPLGCT